MPTIKLLRTGKQFCRFSIKSLPLIKWNGIPRGYISYYAEAETLSPEQRLAFNASEIQLYEQSNSTNPKATTMSFQDLKQVSSYIFYFGYLTTAGSGPLARIECTTNEDSKHVLSVFYAKTTDAVQMRLKDFHCR